MPFQGHTSIGPAHALADPSNGQMTIYSNDMKSYGLRSGVAEFLNIPRDRIRVIWMQGPQAYGRTAADDAGFEAAYLAHQLGKPVRMQWSGTKKPPGTRKALRMSCGCAVDSTRRETSWRSTMKRAPQITVTSVTTSTTRFSSLSSQAGAVKCPPLVESPRRRIYAVPSGARRATWSRCRSCGKRR